MLLFLKHYSAEKQCSKIKTMVLYSGEKNNGFKKKTALGNREEALQKSSCFALQGLTWD